MKKMLSISLLLLSGPLSFATGKATCSKAVESAFIRNVFQCSKQDSLMTESFVLQEIQGGFALQFYGPEGKFEDAVTMKSEEATLKIAESGQITFNTTPKAKGKQIHIKVSGAGSQLSVRIVGHPKMDANPKALNCVSLLPQ